MADYNDYITYAPIADTPNGQKDHTIRFRKEQTEAINLALKQFNCEGKKKFLWNAKMRFGKTLCALELMHQLGELKDEKIRARRLLIVTHRPVVNDSWKDDFNKIFGIENSTQNSTQNGNYQYGTKSESGGETGKSFAELEEFVNSDINHHYVFFVSMQYLRLCSLINDNVDGEKTKDNAGDQLKREILENNWDLVVVDEAHEGTRTSLGNKVIQFLYKDNTKMLHLSGTPFNLYEDFDDDEIFTWDYTMEQKAKANWDPNDGPNPYDCLPKVNIFVYNLGKLVKGKDYNPNDAFSFTEFFRTHSSSDANNTLNNNVNNNTNNNTSNNTNNNTNDNANVDFVHKEEVNQLLELMCKEDENSNYPFSTKKYRKSFRHTLWILPGVSACKAMEKTLKIHPTFKDFSVVNVAGEYEGKATTNELNRVKDAISGIPDDTFTITLSCGRLTTGVTVPAWTAVFYLKGSEDTAAATYMQTIFRVQSPDTSSFKGMMKTNCYVFDFAPDRSLKMIAETAKFSSLSKEKAKRKEAHTAAKADDLKQMEDFMNFCPIISLEGGKMKEFKTEELFEKLDQVYTDRIVRSGFNDNSLYNFKNIIDTMSDDDVECLNKISVSSSKSPNMGKLPIAQKINNNLTPQQQHSANRAKEKKSKNETLSIEEKQALEAEKKWKEERRKERDNRIAILRAISLRIPLMLFGASAYDDDVKDEVKDNTNNDSDDYITLDNFTEKIDDDSWKEFMPQGVDKKTFNRLKKCYNLGRFNSAGRRIRQLAREADELHVEERIARIAEIFSWMHNPDKETVLTPWRVVCQHLSETLGGYCFLNERFDGPCEECVPSGENGQLFDFIPTSEPRFVKHGETTTKVFNTDSHILDINSKTGLYPLYVAYSLYRDRINDYQKAYGIPDRKDLTIPYERSIWDDVLRENVFAICNTIMAKRITERTLRGFRDTKVNVVATDLINLAANNRNELINKLNSPIFWNTQIINFNPIMTSFKKSYKFNAVVGNPPYQQEDNNNNRKLPLYDTFYEIAKDIAPLVTLITPGRFLFNAGQTPKEWNKKMLEDTHFKIVRYEQKSTVFFENVAIKGGVAIGLYDESQKFSPIGIFTVFNELNDILKLVKNKEGEEYRNISEIISNRGFYRFSPKLFEDFPDVKTRLGDGTGNMITSSAFETLPDVFLSVQPENTDDYYQFIGRANGKRTERWVRREYIISNNFLNAWNVVVPQANGTGAIGEVLSTPIIGQPIIGHTDTFISVGQFKTQDEANACLKYVKSKFARALLGILKVTQNTPRDCWKYVPMQDFSADSDIDWGQTVEEIDQQLYRKYELTEGEIAFIEEKIRQMK